MKIINQNRLREVISYNQDSGTFRWNITINNRAIAGDVAGHYNVQGYRVIQIDGKAYLAHRLVFLYIYGYMPEGTVDHINRVRTDNRLANLREVSSQCQARNCSTSRRNSSGIKGVSVSSLTKKWYAYIGLNGKNKSLGNYATKLEASCARYAAEQCLGFLGCEDDSPAKKYIYTQCSLK